MNKKVISAMLAASMAVSLAACGSTATSEASSAVSSETSSTVASGESAASGSYTGTPIKVGGIGPITGAAATYGNAVKNAEELAVKEINAANGSDVFDNVYQICFTDPNQGVASADYIAENALATKIGVIYDSSDAYSSGIYAKFKTEAESKGLEIVTAEAFTSDNKSDLSTQVAKCQEAGAELVFLPIYYTEASQILTTANKTGYEPIFFGCDGMDGILDVEGFDTSLAEGLMLLTPFAADAQDEKTQAFVSAYVAAYGETPNQFAADAYDVIYSMYQAVLETGVTGDMDASEICEQLKTGYTSMTFDGLTGTGMTWDASGAVSKDPKAVVIKDGAYAAM